MTETLSKPRTRMNWSAEEKADWLSLYEKSRQSIAEFCKDNELPTATLSWWRQQAVQADAADARLVEVPVHRLGLAKSAGVSAVTVQLPCGACLEIVAGTDPAWLSQLLRALSPSGA